MSVLTAGVLARLLLARGGMVRVDNLYRDVWPDAPRKIDRGHRTEVQKRILLLRQLLNSADGRGEVGLLTERGGVTSYRLSVAAEDFDLHRFDDLIRRAGVVEPTAAVECLRHALALWTERPLLGLPDRPFIAEAVTRLLDLRARACRNLLAASYAVGEQRAALRALDDLLVRQPDDQDLYSLVALLRHDPGTKAVPRLTPMADAGRQGLSGASASAVSQVWRLPRQVTDLVPRPALIARIREQLDRGPVALVGMPGVGKTRLAAEYAHSFARSYQVAWWLAAEQSDLIDSQLAELAYEAGAAPSTSKVPAAAAAARRFLRTLPGDRVLVVFDNAADAEQTRPLLPDSGHLLITSRNPHWVETASVVPVGVFSREESLSMLQNRLAGLTITDADQIAHELGDLPLALAQAAGLMNQYGLTARDYLACLASHADTITAAGASAAYPIPLSAAVRISMQQLTSVNPRSVRLLTLCAYLAPEPINIRLLTGFGLPRLAEPANEPRERAEPSSTHMSSQEGDAKPTNDDVRDLLPMIGQLGLATIGRGDIHLHRLIRVIIRAGQSVVEQRQLMLETQRLLLRSDPGDVAGPETRAGWRELIPHLLVLEPAESDEPGFRELASRAVTHLLVHGEYRLGLQLAVQLHQRWQTRFGPDDMETLQIGTRLAMARFIDGDLDLAQRLREEIYARLLATVGPDHRQTLITAQHLAWSLEATGDLSRAREMIEKTLERQRYVLGADHADTILSAATLASYLSEVGDAKHAILLARTTHQRAQAALDPRHPWALIPADILAGCLVDAGHLDEALTIAEQTWMIASRHLGEDNPDTLEYAARVAVVLHRQGQTDRARELAQEILARSRLTLGKDHLSTSGLNQKMAEIFD